MTTLKIDLINFRTQSQQLQEKLHQYCTDPQYSLDARWKLWVSSQDLFSREIHKYYVTEIDKAMEVICPNFTWYDDFQIDRYQTAVLVDLVEEIMESTDYGAVWPEDQETWYAGDQPEAIKNLLEVILELDIAGFTQDW